MNREGYHRIGDMVTVPPCRMHPGKLRGIIVTPWYGRDHGAIGPYCTAYWIKFEGDELCLHPHQEVVKATENTPAIVSQ